MKHLIFKIVILAYAVFLLQGCASKQAYLPPVATYKSSLKELYYKDEKESLRSQEQLKAYPVGRYMDPNNPNIMHEAHTIYRLEKPSKWNQKPNKPIVVPLGPTYAITDPNHMKSPISEALEQALLAQTEIMQELQDQNKKLLSRIELLEKERHASDDRNHIVISDEPERREP
jgi:hypothetical protein